MERSVRLISLFSIERPLLSLGELSHVRQFFEDRSATEEQQDRLLRAMNEKLRLEHKMFSTRAQF